METLAGGVAADLLRQILWQVSQGDFPVQITTIMIDRVKKRTCGIEVGVESELFPDRKVYRSHSLLGQLGRLGVEPARGCKSGRRSCKPAGT
jgi:hypothetical protein